MELPSWIIEKLLKSGLYLPKYQDTERFYVPPDYQNKSELIPPQYYEGNQPRVGINVVNPNPDETGDFGFGINSNDMIEFMKNRLSGKYLYEI